MKRLFVSLAFIAAAVSFTACGGGNNGESTTDSTSTTNTTTSTTGEATTTETAGSTDNTSGSTGSSSGPTKDSYTDLSSGSTFTIEKDPSTGYYRNKTTGKRVDFYYDPATNDTFDYRGRVVNNAITRSSIGVYSLDEDKIKIQSDGDVKMKSSDGETKVKMETDGDGKIKTDSTKIKIRDGEVKIKNKS